MYDGVKDQCKECYDAMWAARNAERRRQPLVARIRRRVHTANGRIRRRAREHGVATPALLTVEEASSLWTGRCDRCGVELDWDWHPREPNPTNATIDRVDASEPARGYAGGNMAWVCRDCNIEKGGWDYARQLDAVNKKLAAELRACRARAARGQPSRQ